MAVHQGKHQTAFGPPLLPGFHGKESKMWSNERHGAHGSPVWMTKYLRRLLALVWCRFVQGLIHNVKLLCSCPVCLCATETTKNVLREDKVEWLFYKRYFSQIPRK